MPRPGSARRRRICRSWRARAGPDYIYQFLKTFYIDPTKPTGVNNLRLAATAMPHVLSDLEGLKKVVYKPAGEARRRGVQAFDRFETVAPGRLSAEEYDSFVRDTVNFLDYVSEPSSGAPPRAGRVGGAVPARVHLARVAPQEGVLERRPLTARTL